MTINIDKLWDAVNTAQNDISILSKNNALPALDAVLMNEASDLISRLLPLLNNYQALQDEKTLITELNDFLSKRWDEVAGFYLSYTDSPDSTATQLCLVIARWLHTQDNRRTVYQYLMPTLTDIVESTGVYDDNIDDLRLSQIIVSEDKKSLIPARLIENLSPIRNVALDDLVKPYVAKAGDMPARLTVRERTSLIEHSTTSRKFYRVYEGILDYQADSGSLGGEIFRLIKGLRLGGEHGPYGGSAGVAAGVAYEALSQFMSYWDLLPDRLKEQTQKLRAYPGAHSFQQILDILLKVDTKSLDCVEVNADKLESLLNAHQVLFNQGKKVPGFLKKLGINFDNLKLQFDSQKGVEGREHLPWGPYCFNFLSADYATKLKNNDLMGIILDYKEHAAAIVWMICETGLLTKEMLVNAHTPATDDTLSGYTPIMWAAEYGHTDLVALMLECNAEAEALMGSQQSNETALTCAIGRHPDIAKLILDKTDDPRILHAKKAGKNTPLMDAVEYSRTDVVKMLLEKEMDLSQIEVANDFGCTALSIAVSKSWVDYEIIKLIMDKKSDFDFLYSQVINETFGLFGRYFNPKNVPLMKWAEQHHTLALKCIFENTTDKDVLNPKHPDAVFPLLFAARNGYTDTAKIILDQTDELDVVNARDDFGRTPLMVAIATGHFDIVSVILSKNASLDVLNARDNHGRTPLMYAASEKFIFNNEKEHVKNLIKFILDINSSYEVLFAQDSDGKTALELFSEANPYLGGDMLSKIYKHKEPIAKLRYAIEQTKLGNCPQKIKVEALHYDTSREIANILQSGMCPPILPIEIKMPGWMDDKIAVLQALQSGKCPAGLRIYFSSINNKEVKCFVDALQSGKCPQDLSVNTSTDYEEAMKIAQALQSGKSPAGIRVEVSINYRPDKICSGDHCVKLAQETCTLLSTFDERIALLEKKQALHLHDLIVHVKDLRKAFINQAQCSLRKEKWEKLKAVQKSITYTNKFLTKFSDDSLTREDKFNLIKRYEKAVYPYKTLQTLGECFGVVIVAALCALTGAAFGLGIGALSGLWTGPGAIVTSFAGLFTGASAGWTIGSMITGAALVGTAGAYISRATFFHPSPVQSGINHVIQDCKHVTREEIKAIAPALSRVCDVS